MPDSTTTDPVCTCEGRSWGPWADEHASDCPAATGVKRTVRNSTTTGPKPASTWGSLFELSVMIRSTDRKQAEKEAVKEQPS